MFRILKGPKAILSSAIAEALGEHFIVDTAQIESNLLRDTKIVLRDVLLRERIVYLPVNSIGRPTVVTMSGIVSPLFLFPEKLILK